MKHFKSVLIFILLFTSLIGGDRIAIATKVIGNVQYIRGDGSGRSLKKGHIFESGDILKTDKGGFVALLFIDDKTALKVKENSEIIIAGKRSAENLETTLASIDYKIARTLSATKILPTDTWRSALKKTFALVDSATLPS